MTDPAMLEDARTRREWMDDLLTRRKAEEGHIHLNSDDWAELVGVIHAAYHKIEELEVGMARRLEKIAKKLGVEDKDFVAELGRRMVVAGTEGVAKTFAVFWAASEAHLPGVSEEQARTIWATSFGLALMQVIFPGCPAAWLFREYLETDVAVSQKAFQLKLKRN